MTHALVRFWGGMVMGLLLLAPVSTLWGQQASRGPRVGYVYPAGARRGSTTQAVVGGQYLDGVSQAYVSGSGIQVTVKEHIKLLSGQQLAALRDTAKELIDRRAAAFAWPRMSLASRPSTRPIFTQDDANLLREIREKLATAVIRPAAPAISEIVLLEFTVANDAAIGRRELRLQTAGGLTNPLAFYVGELPEVCENPAKPRAQATVSVAGQQMTVKLPVTINGQILPGGVNRYQFYARKRQSLVAAACARGLTPYLADAVPGWFQATLTLYDAKGNELAYDDDSRVDHDPLLHYVIPSDGWYVIEIKDALYRGREDFVYRLALGELPYVTSVFPLGGPAQAQTAVHLAGWNLPVDTLSEDFRDAVPGIHTLALPEWDGLIPQRLLFAVDDLPECPEQKPNNDQATAQAVNLPIIINGHIDAPGDCEVFRFEGKAGEQIVAEVTARRLGSPLDSVLALTDGSGKQLAYNDDYDDKAAGLVTHQADSYLTATLPSDGPWFIHLRDVQRQGGPEYAYRLRIGHPRPDYQLLLDPSSISVRAGDSAVITVHAIRRDGFSGPIHLTMTGDSQGFRLIGANIPAKQDKAQFKLLAPAWYTDQAVRLHLEGHANIDGQKAIRPVVPADDMMQAFAYQHLVPAEELLAVVLAPRVRPDPIAFGNLRLATTLTAKFVADQLGLPGDRSDKFVSAYVNQRLVSFEQLRASVGGGFDKLTAGGNTREAAALIADTSRAMRGVLEANLSPQQVSKAVELLGPLFGVLERNAAGLLQLDVPQAKVWQAMPILSRFVHAAKVQVYDPVFTGVLSRQDGVMKIHELRLAAAKDLAPIVGADAANKWAEQPAMGLLAPAPRKNAPTTAPVSPQERTSTAK
ncbi:MAG: PPC domain-containing protein [Tepidisphaeraceae bacterium]